MQPRVWLAIFIAAIGWGTSGVATRSALDQGVPPITMVVLRVLIAAGVIYLFMAASRSIGRPSRPGVRVGLTLGVFNMTVPFIASTIALQFAGAGFVGLLIALIPLATAIIANFLLPDEPLRGIKIAAMSVGFAGVAVLLVSGESGIGSVGRPLAATALMLTAVMSIAWANVYAKQNEKHFEAAEVTGLQFAFGFLITVPIALVTEGFPGHYSAWGWTMIGYQAIAGAAMPFLLYFWALKHASITKVALVAYMVPLISLIAGIVVLNEQAGLGIAIGGGLILGSVILVDQSDRWMLSRAGASAR